MAVDLCNWKDRGIGTRVALPQAQWIRARSGPGAVGGDGMGLSSSAILACMPMQTPVKPPADCPLSSVASVRSSRDDHFPSSFNRYAKESEVPCPGPPVPLAGTPAAGAP